MFDQTMCPVPAQQLFQALQTTVQQSVLHNEVAFFFATYSLIWQPNFGSYLHAANSSF